jgi:hypothetical protein
MEVSDPRGAEIAPRSPGARENGKETEDEGMSQAAIDGLATTVLEVQRDRDRWKALAEERQKIIASAYECLTNMHLMNGKLLVDSERLDWLMTTKRLPPQYATREGIDAARSW